MKEQSSSNKTFLRSGTNFYVYFIQILASPRPNHYHVPMTQNLLSVLASQLEESVFDLHVENPGLNSNSKHMNIFDIRQNSFPNEA